MQTLDTPFQTATDELLFNKIESIDFSMIKMKLMNEEHGEGWSKEFTDRVEGLYKKYLYLNAKYPNKHLVPTKDIDTFWHQHILDTRKYPKDCEIIFGHFLHHFPYFGLRSDADKENLTKAFKETRELYMSEFNKSILTVGSMCDGNGTACDPVDPDGAGCEGGCTVEK